MKRSLPLWFLVFGLVLFLSQASYSGDDKPMAATVVKAGDGKITLTFKGDDKKHTHDVAKDAAITLDGKKAKLEDLKAGNPAKVTMDAKYVVTKVEALSKAK